MSDQEDLYDAGKVASTGPQQRLVAAPADPWRNRADQMRCRTCMYYVAKIPGVRNEVGRCRRYGPSMRGFPVVFPHDWCGEHKLDEQRLG